MRNLVGAYLRTGKLDANHAQFLDPALHAQVDRLGTKLISLCNLNITVHYPTYGRVFLELTQKIEAGRPSKRHHERH